MRRHQPRKQLPLPSTIHVTRVCGGKTCLREVGAHWPRNAEPWRREWNKSKLWQERVGRRNSILLSLQQNVGEKESRAQNKETVVVWNRIRGKNSQLIHKKSPTHGPHQNSNTRSPPPSLPNSAFPLPPLSYAVFVLRSDAHAGEHVMDVLEGLWACVGRRESQKNTDGGFGEGARFFFFLCFPSSHPTLSHPRYTLYYIPPTPSTMTIQHIRDGAMYNHGVECVCSLLKPHSSPPLKTTTLTIFFSSPSLPSIPLSLPLSPSHSISTPHSTSTPNPSTPNPLLHTPPPHTVRTDALTQ